MNKQNINRKIASIILIGTLASPIFFIKYTNEKTNEYSIEYTTELPDWFIIDGNVAYPNELYNTVNSLPDFVKEIMKKKNTTINLVESNSIIEEKSGIKNVKGLNYKGDIWVKTIDDNSLLHEIYNRLDLNIIKSDSEGLNFKKIQCVLLHEIGHLVDSNYRFISKNDDFYNIYFQELPSYQKTKHYKIISNSNSYIISNPLEYFATTFACYITNKDELEEFCPSTYSYFDKFILEHNTKEKIKSLNK